MNNFTEMYVRGFNRNLRNREEKIFEMLSCPKTLKICVVRQSNKLTKKSTLANYHTNVEGIIR